MKKDLEEQLIEHKEEIINRFSKEEYELALKREIPIPRIIFIVETAKKIRKNSSN